MPDSSSRPLSNGLARSRLSVAPPLAGSYRGVPRRVKSGAAPTAFTPVPGGWSAPHGSAFGHRRLGGLGLGHPPVPRLRLFRLPPLEQELAQVVGRAGVPGLGGQPPEDLGLVRLPLLLQQQAQVVGGVRVPRLGRPPVPGLRLLRLPPPRQQEAQT